MAHREHKLAGGLIGQCFQLAMQLDAAHANFRRKIFNAELFLTQMFLDDLFHAIQKLLVHRRDGDRARFQRHHFAAEAFAQFAALRDEIFDARQQLPGVERLHEIIIRAGFQTFDLAL